MKTEKVLRGSKEGFCDSVKTNAALVRKRIRDTRLKVEQSSIGVRSNTVVQLLYVEDLVHEELLTAVKERLESFAVDGILDSGMLEQLTEEAWYSPFLTRAALVFTLSQKPSLEPLRTFSVFTSDTANPGYPLLEIFIALSYPSRKKTAMIS